jgi:HEPN domain-containing protein
LSNERFSIIMLSVMTADPEYWLELARYDLGTAKAVLETKRFVYVLVMCQQAIEKTLKALYTKLYGEIPPRIHNLVELSERCEVELTPEQEDRLRQLDFYYIGARYPEDISELSSINEGTAELFYSFTLGFAEWMEKDLIRTK